MTELTNKPAPEIFFTDEGKGNTLIFLHGFLESHEVWNDFAEELSKKYRIICIDLPGFGGSSVLEEEHSMELMAEEVYNIIEIHGINKCVLIGHSMGGYVAMAFAAKYQRFLKGLILLNSQVGCDSEEDKINRDRTIEVVENDKIGFITSFIPSLFAKENVDFFGREIENLREIASKVSKEGVVAAIKGMRNRTDHLETLKTLFCPSMIIAGDKDTRIPANRVKEQAKVSHKVEFHLLEGTGHMSFIEASDKTLTLIKDFTQKVFKK